MTASGPSLWRPGPGQETETQGSSVADRIEHFVQELPFLYGFVQRMGVGSADRDDIIQDVFLVYHRRYADFDTSRPLRPWLTGIAYRVTLDQGRRKREQALGFVDPTDEGARSPEQELARRESVDIVARALQKLPPKQRAVFILHEIEGQDVADLARNLGVPRFTVYSRLRAGRRTFAAAVNRMLGKEGRGT